ncbi:hypothetical protein SCHPADRAFT_998794 [Schizopora paradoxa]|uniref:Extracellular mutant protein 11 C-terminal domain-containing protein n=1 Tax=Schizopora paradoxa TaxID=27342 RepID=A0A0H2RI98_9AGAM|nr:hypothetical protein SCHPADRAFT_998794 [Schizopora paradoxa]
MSARQRFVGKSSASPADAEKSSSKTNENSEVGESTSNKTIDLSKAPEGSTFTSGIEKPLNLASITRPKNRAVRPNGFNTQQQQKKPRTTLVDRVKDSTEGTISRVQSPRPQPLSPRRWENTNGIPQSPFAGPGSASRNVDLSTLSPRSLQMKAIGAGSFRDSHIPRLSDPGFGSRHAQHSIDSALADERSYMNEVPRQGVAKPPIGPGSTGFASPTSSPQEMILDEHSGAYTKDVYQGNNNDIEKGGSSHSLRRMVKRIEHQDVDIEIIEGGPAKRPRLMENGMIPGNLNNIQGTYPMQAPGQRHISPTQAQDLQQYTSPGHTQGYTSTTLPIQITSLPHEPPAYSQHEQQNHAHQDYPQFTAKQRTAHEQALFKLLGTDLEECLTSNAATYEAEKRRWTESTLEEWREGSTELGEDFNKIVTFVKDHMTSKLALFANLDEKINEHRKTLGERDKQLKDLRNKLVSDSGLVLGGQGSGGL